MALDDIQRESNDASDSSTTRGIIGTGAQPPKVVNQFLKLLLRKHSSGDLHSRLKTRKLLGVGETDDGDIHRSKLSQILGHSDQLYIKLPYGLRIWQIIMAVMFTVTGLWASFVLGIYFFLSLRLAHRLDVISLLLKALILPTHIFHTALETDGDHVISLPIRLYGGAVLSLSIVYWMTLNSQDRDIIRMCLLSSIVYFAVQFAVTFGYWLLLLQPVKRNTELVMCLHGIILLVNCFFHWAVTQRKFSYIKRCTSNRDLSKDW